ncbi:MAG: hypothetical protein JNK08_06320 [Sediminibacterium sp.]|nr:hypothetical protein [Sediminibacterium sp.]
MKTTANVTEEFSVVKDGILLNIDNPGKMEALFRKNKQSFQHVFNLLYPEIKDHLGAQFWKERLNQQQEEINWGKKSDLIFIACTALLTGLIAQIPQFTGLRPDTFYARNISILVFPALIVFFAKQQQLPLSKWLILLIPAAITAVYMNSLPYDDHSNTFVLAAIHMPIFLWAVLGYAFTGGNLNASTKKTEFLHFNGNFVVMTAIIFLAGLLFSGITVGLFELIGINIKDFYVENIAAWGLTAIPILATYLVQTNPQLVNKISPLIARIFTPLVLITLISFLSTVLFTGKSLYNDRNFLLVFNGLLIGVVAIIVFSISETSKNIQKSFGIYLLFALSALTILADALAVSAILFRIFEYGISPNRLAVLGGNLLIFINLIFVARKLFLAIRGKQEIHEIENIIALLIPSYGIWAALVGFVFPLLFQFK